MSASDGRKQKRRRKRPAKPASAQPTANVNSYFATGTGATAKIEETIPIMNEENLILANQCLLCRRDRGAHYLQSEQGANGTSFGPQSFPMWVCGECRRSLDADMEQECQDPTPLLESVSIGSSYLPDLPSFDPIALCSCDPRYDWHRIDQDESDEFRGNWCELKNAVSIAYRDCLSPDQRHERAVDWEKLSAFIISLVQQDAHQLFSRLETQLKEYVLEMKLRVLKELTAGCSSTVNARSFVRKLISEYRHLCQGARNLAPHLVHLEREHLQQFGLTWELHNQHLYYSYIYLDRLVQNTLPAVLNKLDSEPGRDGENNGRSEMKDYFDFYTEMSQLSHSSQFSTDRLDDYQDKRLTLTMKQRILREDFDISKIDNQNGDMLENQFKQMMRKLLLKVEPEEKDCVCPTCNRKRCPCDDCGISHMVTCGLLTNLPREARSESSYLSSIQPPSPLPSSSSSSSSLDGRTEQPAEDDDFNDEYGEDDLLEEPVDDSDEGSTEEDDDCTRTEDGLLSTLPNPSYTPLNVLRTDCASCKHTFGPEDPCQCHYCRQQSGQMVSTSLPNHLPTPPQPGGLHLYPHIHGDHTAHMFPTHTLSSAFYDPHSFTSPTGAALPYGIRSAEPLHVVSNWDMNGAGELKLTEIPGESKPFTVPGLSTPFPLSTSCSGGKPDHVHTEACFKNLKPIHSAQFNAHSPKLKSPASSPVKGGSEAIIEHTNCMRHNPFAHIHYGAPPPLSHEQNVVPMGRSHTGPLVSVPVHPSTYTTVSTVSSSSMMNVVPSTSTQSVLLANNSLPPGLPMHCIHHSVAPTAASNSVLASIPTSTSCQSAHSIASCSEQDYCDDGGESDNYSERSSTPSVNQRDGKFCECCYCEFFGHNNTVPGGRNYLEMRERLQKKLKKKIDLTSAVGTAQAEEKEIIQTANCAAQITSTSTQAERDDARELEDLLRFINGAEECKEDKKSTKAAKRQRQKARKAERSRRQLYPDEISSSTQARTSDSPVSSHKRSSPPKDYCSSQGNSPTSQPSLQSNLSATTKTSSAQKKTSAIHPSLPHVSSRSTGKQSTSGTKDSYFKVDNLAKMCESNFVKPTNPEQKKKVSSEKKVDDVESLRNGVSKSNKATQQVVSVNKTPTPASSSVKATMSASYSSKVSPPSTSNLSSQLSAISKAITAVSISSLGLKTDNATSASNKTACSSPTLLVSGHSLLNGNAVKVVETNRRNAVAHLVEVQKKVAPVVMKVPVNSPGKLCNGNLHNNKEHLLANKPDGDKNRKAEVKLLNGFIHRSLENGEPVSFKSKNNHVIINGGKLVSSKISASASEAAQHNGYRPPTPHSTIVPTSFTVSPLRMQNGVMTHDTKTTAALDRGDSVKTMPSAEEIALKVKKNRRRRDKCVQDNELDEIFRPKNLDLVNGDLDQNDRVVEEFKRFCFDSSVHPPARKLPVNVNMKELLKKRSGMLV